MTTPDDAAALARRHERHLETDQQDALAASGTLSHLPVPVSIIWGGRTSTSARRSPPKSRRCSRTHRSISYPAPGTTRNTTSPTPSPSS